MSKKKEKKVTQPTEQSTSKPSLYILLLRWFTWQKVEVILAGLGIVVSIILFLLSQSDSEKEIDIVKNRIFANISTIESTFHPEAIPKELDSLEDVKMVREFQIKSLQICSLWESIEHSDSYVYHLKNSKAQADFVWERNIEREGKCDTLMVQVEHLVCNIQAYAKDNNLPEYTLVSFSKLFKFREQMLEEAEKYKEESAKAIAHFDKNEIEKAYQVYDDMKDNPDFYYFDDTFFDFLVDAGKVYDKALHKYYLDK